MRSYQFLQSDFTDPIVKGENIGGFSAHSLKVTRKIPTIKVRRGQADRPKVEIQVHFKVEGASGFRFEVISKSFFGVINQKNNRLGIGDIYLMELKALEVLRKLLNQLLGKAEVSKLDIKLPELRDLDGEKLMEMQDFIRQLRWPELAIST